MENSNNKLKTSKDFKNNDGLSKVYDNTLKTTDTIRITKRSLKLFERVLK